MNFNNPYLPFFNPRLDFNQGFNPIIPWALQGAYRYPMQYQPQMGLPFQQTPPLNSLNSLSPMMIHQQNNFYGSNFSAQTLQRPPSAPAQKIVTQKMVQNVSKQKKKGLAQNAGVKTQLVKPKQNKIAEIIQIQDSDEEQVQEKQKQQRGQSFKLEAGRLRNLKKQEQKQNYKEQKLRNRETLPRRKADPIFLEGQNQILRQSQMSNSGHLRRSKRNSERISKKIRKIINQEMGTNFSFIRKAIKKNFEKVLALEDEDSNCSKTVKTCYLQRASLPHQITVQEQQEWKQTKLQQLLSRAFA